MEGNVTFHGREVTRIEVAGEPGSRLEFAAPDGTTAAEISNSGDDWFFAGGESLRATEAGIPVAPHSRPIVITSFAGTLVLLSAAPEPEASVSGEFLALVLAWLRSEGGYSQAASVERVTGDGSDWNGGTEGGFYSSFSVDIEWRDDKGGKRWFTASGDDMESLWKYVVRSWPVPAPAP